MAKGGAAVEPVSDAFPGVLKDGAIDRGALKAALSTDTTALSRLESIVHPLVAKSRQDFLESLDAPLVVLDIPLLFETNAMDQVDKIVVVSAPAEVQSQRVLSRGTMTEDQFEMILSKQLPDAEKRARADYVIETLTLEGAQAQVGAILRELLPDA